MSVNAYPLSWPSGWPRTSAQHKSMGSPFRTTFDKAKREMFEELDRMDASNTVISSWLPLKNDGTPRSDSARMKIADPGVAVYFLWRGKRMVMARDAYSTVHDNLRSIGLAIQHLRGLERHGGGTMMERAFEGFAALASPDTFDALAVLGLKAGATREDIQRKYLSLVMIHHPDKGGDPDQFNRITRAREEALRSK